MAAVHRWCLAAAIVCSPGAWGLAAESFPALVDGRAPATLDDVWAGYDPEAEPLESEIQAEWTRDGVVCRVVRYRIGTFKDAPATMVAFYVAPQGGEAVPGVLQIHGGGQSASLGGAVADAKRGYASLSINWGGNPLRFDGQGPVVEGVNTDWGRLDATHPPQRNAVNHFSPGGLAPDDWTLDAVESPRNSNWFLVLVAARRGISFLKSRPEVDPARIGVYGHSMGGTLTTNLAAIDPRVRVAVPSCGGAGVVLAGQVDVPGCVKTRPSPLELACVVDNPAIERLTCPILWLSPTNDFHAPIDNMAITWRNLPDDQVRFSVSPHRNHVHADEHAITQHLWFEQHLTRAFTMPRTPAIRWEIDRSRGVPTEAADRLVDDGSHGWRDWYQVNWGHPPLWRAWTRKVKDPAWRGPEGAALVFDIRCQAANRLLVEFETNGWGAFDAAQPAVSYNAVVPLQAATTARVTSRSPGPGVVRNAVSCPGSPLRRLHRWLVSG